MHLQFVPIRYLAAWHIFHELISSKEMGHNECLLPLPLAARVLNAICCPPLSEEDRRKNLLEDCIDNDVTDYDRTFIYAFTLPQAHSVTSHARVSPGRSFLPRLLSLLCLPALHIGTRVRSHSAAKMFRRQYWRTCKKVCKYFLWTLAISHFADQRSPSNKLKYF